MCFCPVYLYNASNCYCFGPRVHHKYPVQYLILIAIHGQWGLVSKLIETVHLTKTNWELIYSTPIHAVLSDSIKMFKLHYFLSFQRMDRAYFVKLFPLVGESRMYALCKNYSQAFLKRLRSTLACNDWTHFETLETNDSWCLVNVGLVDHRFGRGKGKSGLIHEVSLLSCPDVPRFPSELYCALV